MDDGVRSAFTEVWNSGDFSNEKGLTVTEIMDAVHDGDIRGMYVLGENPAMSDPDVEHARDALAKLEHLVVQDIFLTETANYADVILPASAFAEKSGTVTNTNRQVQMGRPAVEFGAFPPPLFHERLGMNMVLPILPLHGPRTMGRRSGDGFLGGEILDTLHAASQAAWDIRRLFDWIRQQSDAPIGMLGLSLGGYTTALTSSLDDGLRFAIPGIPVADLGTTFFRHGPTLEVADATRAGLTAESVSRLLRVASPLGLEPRVPFERRFIFGATADRLVPPFQVRNLWRHWGRPRIHWYPGSHVSFRMHPSVQSFVTGALADSHEGRP